MFSARAGAWLQPRYHVPYTDFCEHMFNRRIGFCENLAQHLLDVHPDRTVPARVLAMQRKNTRDFDRPVDIQERDLIWLAAQPGTAQRTCLRNDQICLR
jgi:hypothetical protein